MDFLTHTITSTDGVRLAVREWGNPEGPELIFIHGIGQCQLAFSKQVGSPLLQKYRMITYDLRGHGESDKPLEPSHYVAGALWANDLNSILDGLQLSRPVLVGWSLGGRVISQYVDIYGDKCLRGINFVGSRTLTDPNRPTLGEGGQYLLDMCEPGIEANVLATSKFIRACVNSSLDPEEFQYMLAYNMLTPPYVRAATLQWPGNFLRALEEISVPTLVTHGMQDKVVLPLAAEITLSKVKNSYASWYEDTGHSPFWEQPNRFNSELNDFLDQLR